MHVLERGKVRRAERGLEVIGAREAREDGQKRDDGRPRVEAAFDVERIGGVSSGVVAMAKSRRFSVRNESRRVGTNPGKPLQSPEDFPCAFE